MKWECPLCKVSVAIGKQRTAHLTQHGRTLWQRCQHCPYMVTATRTHDLVRHMAATHGGPVTPTQVLLTVEESQQALTLSQAQRRLRYKKRRAARAAAKDRAADPEGEGAAPRPVAPPAARPATASLAKKPNTKTTPRRVMVSLPLPEAMVFPPENTLSPLPPLLSPLPATPERECLTTTALGLPELEGSPMSWSPVSSAHSSSPHSATASSSPASNSSKSSVVSLSSSSSEASDGSSTASTSPHRSTDEAADAPAATPILAIPTPPRRVVSKEQAASPRRPPREGCPAAEGRAPPFKLPARHGPVVRPAAYLPRPAAGSLVPTRAPRDRHQALPPDLQDAVQPLLPAPEQPTVTRDQPEAARGLQLPTAAQRAPAIQPPPRPEPVWPAHTAPQDMYVWALSGEGGLIIRYGLADIRLPGRVMAITDSREDSARP